ncbi:coiled-coil domain-containing protein 174 [Episyrphus balteatus]|uniref:coiled-coil domain-containing protein 174 n=1 Tax=Episyrphus balteatus TaxID=286459 RepID=UPI002485EA73|nr:coiled-coil domain-containing protein 174 [Episyrphus balteatus]
MNDPNKKIDVNLSSLMSLKAELLRKQAEVSKVKATRSTTETIIIPNKAKTYKKDTITELEKDKKDSPKVYEIEDTALLEKSRKVLEAKSKFYDKMTKMGGQLNSDDNCLVLFNRKKQEDPRPLERKAYSSSDDSESDQDHGHVDEESVDPDEEWVEYTDCLGRTRKCMRGDLESIKKKDTELAASIPERLDQSQPNWMIDVVGNKKTTTEESEAPASVLGDGASIMSKHDEMRNNWEKKEIENVTKENVHYQDVFFDEARQHGVGYYAFSTDEEERARQQKELEETRKKTLNEQANKEAQRNYREKIIAERVKAAKNRQRARLGLPPLEDEEIEDKPAKETKEERKQRKKEEKQKRRKEKEEQIREEERQSHIRPWDREKANGHSETSEEEPIVDQPWAYRPDREPMSQEEWNEKKRTERNPEFAPSAEEPRRKMKYREKPSSAGMGPEPKMSRTSFKADDSMYNMPPPPPPTHNPFANSSFAPFQSTKKSNNFVRKNYTGFDNEDKEEAVDIRRGAEIPPPRDLDPEPYVRSRQTSDGLESSIEAGLKFLRNNFDKNTLSNKSSWTARSDY